MSNVNNIFKKHSLIGYLKSRGHYLRRNIINARYKLLKKHLTETESLKIPPISFLVQLEMLKPIVICEEKKYIYMKTTKAAGTSIYRHVLKDSLKHKTINDLHDFNKIMRWISSLNTNKWNDYFKFSFIRNPWDRAVSIYCYFVNIKRLKCAFSDFITNFEYYTQKDIFLLHHSTSCYDMTHHNGKQIVDFIGRVESLQTDLNYILKKIGEKPHICPKVNVSNKDGYKKFYNSETTKIVESLYHKDIETFNYSF